jgi:parallel beta-helix repeat protein
MKISKRVISFAALACAFLGASHAGERATGLARPFPEAARPPDNPTTPERVELGRLLFYDPVLSGDNTLSCAHCHHPALGFSDGLPRSRGKGATGVGESRRGGVELTRAAPTLWNALYNHRQFWDGRAESLEAQARGPITDPGEMDEDPERLAGELRAIEEYRRLFQAAFPDAARGGGGAAGLDANSLDTISIDTVVRAIAAFERTLVSVDSRYDRFAAGDASALAPEEVRGLKTFLSSKARCNECHTIPTFARPAFKVIGVPEPPGGPPDVVKRGAGEGRGGPGGAFKVPTLRNIALTAPYMHNGVFATLEEVVDFYAGGGGRGRGLAVPLQDDKVRKFELSKEERDDLIAFLRALTDTSHLPAVPVRVPSGLPVVDPLDSSPPSPSTPRSAAEPAPAAPAQRTVEVRPGESIQAAVDRAGRGGEVRVHPGVYREDVLVLQHGVTLSGRRAGGERPVLLGEGKRGDGVTALGDDFTVEGLELRDYQGNGVLVHGARNVTFRDLVVRDPGLYGVYPVECDGVLVEGCSVSGARDAGIYVGQSRRIKVLRNEAFRNVVGIEVENSSDALVEGNHVHANTGGILVVLLPFNPSKEASGTRLVGNRVHENNTENFADPGAIVASVLPGTGILILGADRTEVTANEIRGNRSYGVAVSSLRGLYPPPAALDVDPLPDESWIHENRLEENGGSPDARLEALGLPGRDLIWDGSGRGNRWREPAGSRFPATLPAGAGGDEREGEARAAERGRGAE